MPRRSERDADVSYRAARARILAAAKAGWHALDLSRCGLTTLPPEIGRCHDLKRLDLTDNFLEVIPPEIGRCFKLEQLQLADNRLDTLPIEIGRCRALETLELQNNSLTSMPETLRELDNLRALYLHGNDKLHIPAEMLGPTKEPWASYRGTSPKAILDYYFSRQRGGAKPLNEVKLVLVGRGGAGKTSLIERLTTGTFTAGKKETLGIALCDWRLDNAPGGPVTAHVWDFAGQVITHSMHQFFFSVRTIYVLVLTGRENSERDDAEYWLRLIAAFGSERRRDPHNGAEIIEGPPVIVVLNKWDDPGSARPRLDRRALLERYPFIVDFVETDCATGHGIEKLHTRLSAVAGTLKWVREGFPAEWASIKDKLSRMAEPHMGYDTYRLICRQDGLTDEERQDNLAEVLHALGIALNYRKDERLRDATVLKPHWLTENAYALLRHAERKHGVLTLEELPHILPDERSERMRLYLVDLMQRFEIAYPLGSAENKVSKWLLPQALPNDQPEGVESFNTSSDAARLRYRYRVLPVGLVPQFIVRTHPLIEAGKRWASGVVLGLNGSRALVRSDTYERTVEVTVIGNDSARQQLAGLCQAELRAIHSQFRGLEVDEETQAAGQWIPIQTLERDEAHGRKTGVATSLGTVEVDPATELNAFSAPAARDDSWKPRIFVSYAHSDEAQRRKLDLHLKVLATQGLVHSAWHDRKIQPGEDWDRTIKSELEFADVILFLVSTASLASNYIHTVEMKSALKRHADKKAVLIPIILERCVWDAPPLRGFQALPKDAKALNTWNPRSNGWHSIADGLRILFTRLRSQHTTR